MKRIFEVTFIKPDGSVGKDIVDHVMDNQAAESYISITRGVKVLASSYRGEVK